MFKLALLCVALCLTSLAYAQGTTQYGVQAAYLNANCTGPITSFASYRLNTCLALGSPVTYLIVTANNAGSNTTFYNDPACSILSNQAPVSYSLGCVLMFNIGYANLSISNSLPSASVFSSAYNTSSFFNINNSSCSGAPVINTVRNSSYCFDPNVKYICNSTHTTIRTYGSANCTGTFTDISQLISAGCQGNTTNTCANIASSTTGLTSSTSGTTVNSTSTTSTSSSSTGATTSTSTAGFITPSALLFTLVVVVFYL